MAKQFKCTNYGICKEADNGTIFPEAELEEIDGKYECPNPNCHQELEELKEVPPKGKLIAIIVAAVLALGVAAFFLLRNKGPKVIPVESVTLDQTEVTLQDSEPFELTATVLPEEATYKTVVWSVSDENIVKSNGDGTFQCMNEGEATVTATVGEVSATCQVTVTPLSMYSPVESVTLDKKNLSLKVGATAELMAAVAPIDAEDMSVTWTSSDEAVVTVEEGKVRAVKEGKAIVTVVSVSNPEVKDDCEVTVTGGSTGYSLGWGIYTGPMQGGKPHGLGGDVKVTKAYTLDLKKGNGDVRHLDKGDKIEDCKFKEGRLVSGYIHYKDGRQERIDIGA